MGTERFTEEEALRLFSQESEPPTARDRLSSMMAILNIWKRNGFPKTTEQELNHQLAVLARGIFDAPEEERVEVDGIVRSYRRNPRREIRKLGKRLHQEIVNAAKLSPLRTA